MKKLILAILFLFTAGISLKSQIAGYYNGTEGKTGDDLKAALHEIIKGHVDFSYSDAKYLMNYADADVSNENNVILIYTRRSQSNTTWGSGSNDINREHVWSKSHGNFEGIRPMDGDVNNLHPADASVNITKSNLDFDECSATGTLIAEANAYYTSTQFEPQDAAKGEVARTIFYMAVRYEGTDGEIDLEMADRLGTADANEYGKMSTLLQWNRDFPPSDRERRRNERIWDTQKNRNPFIDHPEYADLIWAGATLSPVSIGDIAVAPEIPVSGSSPVISATVTSSAGSIASATLYYGSTYSSETSQVSMSGSGNTWSAALDLSSFSEGQMIYFKIVVSDGSNQSTIHSSIRIPKTLTVTPISTVQGTGSSTTMSGSIVTVSGVVTANFDNSYYLQSGTGLRSGICIYDIKRGQVGDSVTVTGQVTEYSTLTEIQAVSYCYHYGKTRAIEPVVLTIDQVNEDYEGMLVTFKNVTFLNGDTEIPLDQQATLNFTDGVSTLGVYSRYNSRLGGKILPGGTVNVTGVVSQYNGTYQILVNDISDIQAGDDSEAPFISTVTVIDKDWIQIDFNEKVEETSAETISNYSIPGLTILGAYLYETTKVLLLTSGLQVSDYTLTINGVSDLQGNVMDNVSFNFHSDYENPDAVKDYSSFPVKIWPNPATGGRLFYEAPAEVVGIRVYTLEGKVVYSESRQAAAQGELDIVDYTPGLYLLFFRLADGNSINFKLEIE
ncbi:MAG: endonuclease [Bacteroidota bacterium]